MLAKLNIFFYFKQNLYNIIMCIIQISTLESVTYIQSDTDECTSLNPVYGFCTFQFSIFLHFFPLCMIEKISKYFSNINKNHFISLFRECIQKALVWCLLMFALSFIIGFEITP